MSEEEKAELEELYENSEWWHNRFNAVQRDYENVMIANKMLEQENKQLKEDKKKVIEYIKQYNLDGVKLNSDYFYDCLVELLEILGDKENE